MLNYKIDAYDGVKSAVVVFHDGELYTAHVGVSPNFAQIVERLEANPADESVVDLFNLERAVSNAFQRVSSHMTVKNGQVLYDGDVMDDAVTKQILRLVDENALDRAGAVARFAERLRTSPQVNTDAAFLWLREHNFTITDDGLVVGYKGCFDHLGDGTPVSSRRAPASDQVIRNDEAVVGDYVKNLPGDVIEMPRSVVEDNAAVGCGVGLHFGTYGYASSFGPMLVEVHVDPADFVSVPTDCAAQKVRTCRYTVIGPVSEQYAEAVLPAAQTAPVDEDATDLDDEDFSEVNEDPKTVLLKTGDTVRTVNRVCPTIWQNGDDVPLGTLATVLEDQVGDSTWAGIEVDLGKYGRGNWIRDRFEKVESEDEPQVGDIVIFLVDKSRMGTYTERGGKGRVTILPGDGLNGDFYTIDSDLRGFSGNYYNREDFRLVGSEPVNDVTKAQAWDTRQNHTIQKRYPAGTYKNGKSVAGRFIPKDSSDYNRY